MDYIDWLERVWEGFGKSWESLEDIRKERQGVPADYRVLVPLGIHVEEISNEAVDDAKNSVIAAYLMLGKFGLIDPLHNVFFVPTMLGQQLLGRDLSSIWRKQKVVSLSDEHAKYLSIVVKRGQVTGRDGTSMGLAYVRSVDIFNELGWPYTSHGIDRHAIKLAEALEGHSLVDNAQAAGNLKSKPTMKGILQMRSQG